MKLLQLMVCIFSAFLVSASVFEVDTLQLSDRSPWVVANDDGADLFVGSTSWVYRVGVGGAYSRGISVEGKWKVDPEFKFQQAFFQGVADDIVQTIIVLERDPSTFLLARADQQGWSTVSKVSSPQISSSVEWRFLVMSDGYFFFVSDNLVAVVYCTHSPYSSQCEDLKAPVVYDMDTISPPHHAVTGVAGAQFDADKLYVLRQCDSTGELLTWSLVSGVPKLSFINTVYLDGKPRFVATVNNAYPGDQLVIWGTMVSERGVISRFDVTTQDYKEQYLNTSNIWTPATVSDYFGTISFAGTLPFAIDEQPRPRHTRHVPNRVCTGFEVLDYSVNFGEFELDSDQCLGNKAHLSAPHLAVEAYDEHGMLGILAPTNNETSNVLILMQRAGSDTEGVARSSLREGEAAPSPLRRRLKPLSTPSSRHAAHPPSKSGPPHRHKDPRDAGNGRRVARPPALRGSEATVLHDTEGDGLACVPLPNPPTCQQCNVGPGYVCGSLGHVYHCDDCMCCCVAAPY